MITPEELAHWQALCDAATPEGTDPDAYLNFFIAAREAMPRLIARVRELETISEQKRQAYGYIDQQGGGAGPIIFIKADTITGSGSIHTIGGGSFTVLPDEETNP